MTEQALNQLTRQIMLDAAQLEYGSLLEEAPEHIFSPAFERKMKKLLRQGRHPVLYRTLRGAACLLLVLLLSGCAILAVSPAAREVFTGWVREIYETTFVYRYSGTEQGVSEDTAYLPTWIPDGYTRISSPALYGQVNIIYEHPDQNVILFNYILNPQKGQQFYAGREDAEISRVKVHDFSADLYLYQVDNAANLITWTNENGVLLWIVAPLEKDDLIRMAESVEIVKPHTDYRLTWLPEGYWETERPDLVGMANVLYQNDAGDMIVLLYTTDRDAAASLVIQSENVTVRKVQVNGQTADLYLDNQEGNRNLVVWIDRETGMLFGVSGPQGESELLKMAESIGREP